MDMTKKILVTNDDGIDARGLIKLVEALADSADVYVAAPMVQHSAKSQSITFLHEVDIEERDMEGVKKAWAVHGTPADCVKIGLLKLTEEGISPDFVISGINMGNNAGLAAYYSGTIAAAREGALNGIRSVALSVQGHEASEFSAVTDKLSEIMKMSERLDTDTVLSVNAPEVTSSELKGIKIVPAAPFGYGVLYDFRRAESGNYQLDAVRAYMDDQMRYDFDWLIKGYMTVSPLPTSLEAPEALAGLKEAFPEQ